MAPIMVVLVMAFLEATQVMSQTTITRSTNVESICEDESIDYTCVEQNTSVNVEWTVEGFIDNAIFVNSGSRLGRIFQSTNGEIRIVQVAVDPLTTVMTIPGIVTQDLSVICSGSNPAVATYTSGARSREVSPPTIRNVSSVSCGDPSGGIVFEIRASTSPDVVQYIVGCEDDGCVAAVFDEIGPTRIDGMIQAVFGTHRLVVRGVNRCGNESVPVLSNDVIVEECKDLSPVALGVGIAGIVLLLISLTLGAISIALLVLYRKEVHKNGGVTTAGDTEHKDGEATTKLYHNTGV